MRYLNRLVLASLLAVSFSSGINAEEVQSQEENTCVDDVCLNAEGLVGPCVEAGPESKSYSCHSAWHRAWQWRWNPRDGWHRHGHC